MIGFDSAGEEDFNMAMTCEQYDLTGQEFHDQIEHNDFQIREGFSLGAWLRCSLSQKL